MKLIRKKKNMQIHFKKCSNGAFLNKPIKKKNRKTIALRLFISKRKHTCVISSFFNSFVHKFVNALNYTIFRMFNFCTVSNKQTTTKKYLRLKTKIGKNVYVLIAI